MIEKPKRKQIRLKEFDYSQKAYYFVTICAYNRKNLFGEIVGENLCVRPNTASNILIKWLLEIENKYENIIVDKYVIMPNHIHFILINTGEHAGSPLQEIIKWYKTQTTNEYIKHVKTGLLPPFDKHIWQRNYYDHIIRNEKEFTEISQYINNNPIKWTIDKYYN